MFFSTQICVDRSHPLHIVWLLSCYLDDESARKKRISNDELRRTDLVKINKELIRMFQVDGRRKGFALALNTDMFNAVMFNLEFKAVNLSSSCRKLLLTIRTKKVSKSKDTGDVANIDLDLNKLISKQTLKTPYEFPEFNVEDRLNQITMVEDVTSLQVTIAPMDPEFGEYVSFDQMEELMRSSQTGSGTDSARDVQQIPREVSELSGLPEVDLPAATEIDQPPGSEHHRVLEPFESHLDMPMQVDEDNAPPVAGEGQVGAEDSRMLQDLPPEESLMDQNVSDMEDGANARSNFQPPPIPEINIQESSPNEQPGEEMCPTESSETPRSRRQQTPRRIPGNEETGPMVIPETQEDENDLLPPRLGGAQDDAPLAASPLLAGAHLQAGGDAGPEGQQTAQEQGQVEEPGVALAEGAHKKPPTRKTPKSRKRRRLLIDEVTSISRHEIMRQRNELFPEEREQRGQLDSKLIEARESRTVNQLVSRPISNFLDDSEVMFQWNGQLRRVIAKRPRESVDADEETQDQVDHVDASDLSRLRNLEHNNSELNITAASRARESEVPEIPGFMQSEEDLVGDVLKDLPGQAGEQVNDMLESVATERGRSNVLDTVNMDTINMDTVNMDTINIPGQAGLNNTHQDIAVSPGRQVSELLAPASPIITSRMSAQPPELPVSPLPLPVPPEQQMEVDQSVPDLPLEPPTDQEIPTDLDLGEGAARTPHVDVVLPETSAHDFLGRIVDVARQGETMFSTVCPPAQVDRISASLDFYNLLKLHKTGYLEAEQQHLGDEINITLAMEKVDIGYRSASSGTYPSSSLDSN